MKSGWKTSEAMGSAGAVGAIVTIATSAGISDLVKATAIGAIAAIACTYAGARAITKAAHPLSELTAFLWSFRASKPQSGTPSTPTKD